MSKKDEALKLALEALVDARVRPPHKQDSSKYEHAITAIREALAEPVEWLTGCPECGMDGGCDCDSGTWNPPAQQEPVAEVKLKERGGNAGIATVIHEIFDPMREPLRVGDKLYTSPPASKPWVGLTDEEVNACDPQEECWNLLEVSRAIEAKLREKNA